MSLSKPNYSNLKHNIYIQHYNINKSIKFKIGSKIIKSISIIITLGVYNKLNLLYRDLLELNHPHLHQNKYLTKKEINSLNCLKNMIIILQ
jgi:hypothetical protein